MDCLIKTPRVSEAHSPCSLRTDKRLINRAKICTCRQMNNSVRGAPAPLPSSARRSPLRWPGPWFRQTTELASSQRRPGDSCRSLPSPASPIHRPKAATPAATLQNLDERTVLTDGGLFFHPGHRGWSSAGICRLPSQSGAKHHGDRRKLRARSAVPVLMVEKPHSAAAVK